MDGHAHVRSIQGENTPQSNGPKAKRSDCDERETSCELQCYPLDPLPTDLFIVDCWEASQA